MDGATFTMAESCGTERVKFLKSHAQVLLDHTGAPPNLWFLAQQYLVDVYMVTSQPQLKWQTPTQVSRGDTLDISHILVFQFFEPVLYLDPRVAFPETKELPGYFVGFAKNTGDTLTFKVLKTDMRTILHRSVVRSAKDTKNMNKRVHFQPDIRNNTTVKQLNSPIHRH